MEKPIDKKAVETLAMLIASKTGLDDDYASVAHKVIADYVGAKKVIQEYNEKAEKIAKKLAKSPKEKKAVSNKRKKNSQKAIKKAAGE